MSFDYPVGIPSAWIDPNIQKPSRPVDWSEEVPGYYYIDPSNYTTASKGLTYGHPNAPLDRVPLILPAGSYVELHGSGYTYTSTLYPYASGTEERPVWIIGGEGNSINMAFVLTGTYLYIDGLNLVGNHGIQARPYSSRQTDHLLIRNCTLLGTGVYGAGTSGISMNGESGLTMEGVICYNNYISYMGDSETWLENDNHAFQTGSNINHVWILYNHSHHNGGDGVQFSHGGTNANHFYYGGNISHDEGENCVDIKVADDVVVSTNLFYGIEERVSSPGEAVVTHYNGKRQWIINNIIHSAAQGVVSTGCFDLHVSGNVIYNMREVESESHSDLSTYQTGAAIRAYSTGNMYVSNNTIFDCVRGVAIEAISGYELVVENNIITNLVSGVYSANNPYNVMLRGSSSTVAGATFRNNLFSSPETFHFNGTTYNTVQDFKNTGAGEGFLSDYPSYADYPSNVRINAGGNTLGKGSTPISYGYFDATYAGEGVFINADMDLKLREDSIDLGAYQLVGNFVPAVPKQPSNFVINVLDSSLNWELNSLNEDYVNIYKGENILTTLPTGSTEYSLANVNTSVDSYKIIVGNSTGDSEEIEITSSIISAILNKGEVNRVITDDFSHRLIREYALNEDSITIPSPVFTGTEYTTSTDVINITKPDGTVCNGFNYVLGESGNGFSGSTLGVGDIEFLVSSNNFSSKTVNAYFKIDDSVVKIENMGGFIQAEVTVTSGEEGVKYSMYSTSDSIETSLGISAIIER